MKLGVCYYPEHWPTERWPIDARMMREAGLSIVRVAEFAWTRMEPAAGTYTWDWLDRAVETLAAEGLKIILGTPTATPPAWVIQAHPEILPVGADGLRRNFGARRHYCLNNPDYQRHTRRIVSAMAERYKNHPAVIGWQIDNEFGLHDTARCYCPVCTAAFRGWLKTRYGTLDSLNHAWGAVFWNQTYTAWEQIQPPNRTTTEANPGHVLDYYRFSSDSNVSYQQIQVDILRSAIPSSQFITHNFMGNFPDLDYHDLARSLDFVSWDSYPAGYHELHAQTLYHPDEPRPNLAHDLGDPYVTGFCHDIMRGLKQKNFWVMEQQCGQVNWSTYNTGVLPGALRLWTWQALGHGADTVVYFRWRACLYAQEQMHSGLLHHDASPDTGYEDLLALQPELETMQTVSAEPIPARVAMLYNYDDLWALQLQPHRKDFGYQRHLFIYYRALMRLGIPVDLVSRDADLSRYNLVIAPTAYLAGPEMAQKLQDYVSRGGVLLLGVRSGFKTTTNRVTDQPLPGDLRALAGATVRSWHSLPPGVSYPLQSDLPAFDAASVWADLLTPEPSTRVHAAYSAPHAAQAALTEHAAGQGAVFYCGIYPTDAQARSLISLLASRAGVQALTDEPLPEGLVASARGSHTILLNFTTQPLTARVRGQSYLVPARDARLI